jgi:hypothetical protein
MSRITTKFLVADETGPIRAFYSLPEAQKFAQEGWSITEVREVRYEPKKPSYDDLITKYGKAIL